MVELADLSPDGRLLASASFDSNVKIWDIASGALQRTLLGHAERVQSVVFSPDGRLIASGSSDQTIKLWETATGNIQHSLEGHEQAVRLVKFSPDARLLASSSRREIRLWDTTTGVQQQKITTDYSVAYLRFSSNGLFLETHRERFDIPASYNYINSAILLEPIPNIKILGNLNQWVALSGKKVLWLPPNYRPYSPYKTTSVGTDGMMILGHDSGRVTFFQFQC